MPQSLQIIKEIGRPTADREYELSPTGLTAGMRLKGE